MLSRERLIQFPPMRTKTTLASLAVLVLLPLLFAASEGLPEVDPNANTLTDAEKAAGWKLLFDGKTTDGWRGYKLPAAPATWIVENGVLTRTGGGGDLLTKEKYENFELMIQWKISPGGNSGIVYRVTEEHKYCWETGPEYQVLDNAGHKDGKVPLTTASSCYALYAPTKDMARPVGQWNQARLLVDGNHVEHWLNGEKVVEYEMHGPEWTERVKTSKFKTMPDYGKNKSGYLDLQDHGDPVWYRSIKIRVLPTKEQK